ncbi:hypothetical protein ACLK1S_05345 [Escherichia coli]
MAGRVCVIWMAKIFSLVIAQAQQMAGFPYSEIPHLITRGLWPPRRCLRSGYAD